MPLNTRASSLTALTAGVLLAGLLVSGCSSSDRSMAKGDQLFEQKDYRAALLEYRRAVSKEPKAGEARRKLARTYRALGSMDAAWREYVRAADVLPDDADAQLDAVQALLDTGQFEDAKVRAERLIGRDSRNVRAHVLRGLATAGLKDLDGAVKDVKTALELDPSRASNYVNLGAIQLALGQSAEAEAALKQAVALAPKDLAPRLALANFYWRVGRKDETEQALKEAVAIAPKDVDANMALSMFYVSTARSADAEAPLKTAAENPDALEIRLMRADYYVANQRLADAAKVLEQLSSQPLAHAAAESRLAGIEYVKGNHEAAYGKVDALLKRDPKNVPVLILKSRWLLSEKKTDEALASAKAAVAADPKSATAHYVLARVYTAQNNAQQAMAEYNEVLAIAPGATLAQLELAQI